MRSSIKQQLYLFILLIFSSQRQHFKVNTHFRQFMDALMPTLPPGSKVFCIIRSGWRSSPRPRHSGDFFINGRL